MERERDGPAPGRKIGDGEALKPFGPDAFALLLIRKQGVILLFYHQVDSMGPLRSSNKFKILQGAFG